MTEIVPFNYNRRGLSPLMANLIVLHMSLIKIEKLSHRGYLLTSGECHPFDRGKVGTLL